MLSIKHTSKHVAKGQFLWELIAPKDKDGQPTKSASGRYYVKCYVMDCWRSVLVDDRMPVDLFGRPLPVGIRPLQLWPLILSKAVLKLMAAYEMLEVGLPHQVPAFQWLTGWPQENLLDPLSGISYQGGALFDRLEEVCKEAPKREDRHAVASVCLLNRAAAERPPPRLIVLCGPSAVGKGRLMELLVERHADLVGRTVSHTTRRPMEHEEHGKTYFFSNRATMRSEIADVKFLESAEVSGVRGTSLYGASLATVREVAATGKLCCMGMDLQGVRALQANKRVDGLYLYVAPPSLQELEARQRGRLREAESTIQKRIIWAKQQMEASATAGLFDHMVQNSNLGSAYEAIKDAISTLSPIIRNRLKGMPAYVLDYSDLIPSNSVEKPFLKPVIIAGPSAGDKQQLINMLVSEFPDVFGFARVHTTEQAGSDEQGDIPLTRTSEDEDQSGLNKPEPVVLSKDDFKAHADQGKFLEHHTDLFVHERIRHRTGVMREDVATVIGSGRLAVLDCDVEGARMVKASGQDCLTIFVAPPSVQEYEVKVREWLRVAEADIQAMQAAAKAELDLVTSQRIFDHVLVNDQLSSTFEQLRGLVSKYRPDIIPPDDGTAAAPASAAEQAPLVMCGPSAEEKEALVTRLMHDYPGKFARAVRHTSRKQEKGEEEGGQFAFVKKDALQKMAEEGKLLEWSEVAGVLTGTSRAAVHQVAAQGQMCLLDMDVQRALAVDIPNTLRVFVEPASTAALEQRIRAGAGPKAKEADIQQALQAPLAEIQKAKASGAFALQIVNTDADTSYFALKEALPDSEAFEVISREAAEQMVSTDQFLVHDVVLGDIYGLTRAAVKAVQYAGKVCVIDCDKVGHAVAMRAGGLAGAYLLVTPEGEEGMLQRIRADVVARPPAGYEPEEAVQQLFKAAYAEVQEARAHASCFDVSVESGSEPERAYFRLLEQISFRYPPQMPACNVWGYGRPLWDPACRIYGLKPLRVMVLGPAAAGKSTQCERLGAQIGVPHINVGELLYAEVQARTELGLEAKRFVDASKTVPDHVFITLVMRRLSQEDCVRRGWLLDGFPHTATQVAALREAGMHPDKVIFMDATHATLLERAKYRRLDPATRRAYLVPPQGSKLPQLLPMSADGRPDSAAVAHLTVRHDDTEENVRRRLGFWDCHGRALRAEFADHSMRVEAALDPDSVYAEVSGFVTLEERLGDSAASVSSRSLSQLQYEVLETVKYRGRQRVRLMGPDRKQCWVELADLAGNSRCMLLHQDPGTFSTSQQIRRNNLAATAWPQLLHVDSPEPINILLSLTSGPHRLLTAPLPDTSILLVVCGPASGGKSSLITMLLADHPDKFGRAVRHTLRGLRSPEELEALSASNQLAECSPPYATSVKAIQAVQESGRMCIIEAGVAALRALRAAGRRCVAVYVDAPSHEVLDVRLRNRGDVDEQTLQALLAAALAERSAAEEPGLFDCRLVNDNLLHCYTELVAFVSRHWPASRAPQTVHLVAQAYDWAAGGPGETFKRLACSGGASSRLELPRGRHLLRLQVDADRLHTLDLRSSTPFKIGDANKVLAEQQALAVRSAEGVCPAQAGGSWRLWFRYSFSLAETCRVGADLAVASDAQRRAVQLLLVDNDTSQETRYLLRSMAPGQLLPNSTGYSLVAMSACRQDAAEEPFKLAVTSDKPLKSWEERLASRVEAFEGQYAANKQLVLCRYVVTAAQRCAVACCLQATMPAALSLSLFRAPEGAIQWQAEAEELSNWTGTSQVSFAGLHLAPAKYLLQASLDPGSCNFPIAANGGIGGELAWKLWLAPAADTKGCTVAADDSRQKYSQATFAKWAEGQKDRVKAASAALEAFKGPSALAGADATVTVTMPSKEKGAEPLVLHPDQFMRGWARRHEAEKAAVEAGESQRQAAFMQWRATKLAEQSLLEQQRTELAAALRQQSLSDPAA
ncbi:hypothetical protein WJX72_002676 [[Myrmecia] bisecta]|uniref:adenylate kinase n=1 Tax=[Myrmecia] bisecta TaxID=41462 RepID=A0AAW1PJV2_9CHLO